MSSSSQAAAGNQEQVTERNLLDQIVDEGRVARDPAGRERGKNLVKEFVSQFLEGSMTLSPDSEAMINMRIAQIDHLKPVGAA
jgi:type VI secretion system protein ImpC